ncbi:MAG: hypothetical protein PHF63_02940, partial [Herbinix sp.]|nr:hypothetical protein [Herbinix sp.]
AGVLSYKAAMYFWQPKEEATQAYQEDTVSDNSVKAGMDDVPKNLIFCYKEDTGEITKVVLEILNPANKQLSYITLPLRTQLNISVALFRKLVVDCPEIPQVMQLGSISKYLDNEKAYEDGVLMVEELLGMDISYYTAIPQSTFNTIFTDKYIEQADQYDSVAMVIFMQDYRATLQSLDSEEKLRSYLDDIYPTLKSNLDLEDKLSYVKGYYEAYSNDVSFDLIKGNNINSAYIIDLELAAQQLTELTR